MILLDTNVVSETMRPAPDPRVVRWLNAQVAETLFLSSISIAELLLGIAILPDGKRKQALTAIVEERVAVLFGARLLAFDRPAARAYAAAIGAARAAGRAIGVADGQIAAIAIAHGYAVATRDAAPFRAVGVVVIDPWAVN